MRRPSFFILLCYGFHQMKKGLLLFGFQTVPNIQHAALLRGQGEAVFAVCKKLRKR